MRTFHRMDSQLPTRKHFVGTNEKIQPKIWNVRNEYYHTRKYWFSSDMRWAYRKAEFEVWIYYIWLKIQLCKHEYEYIFTIQRIFSTSISSMSKFAQLSLCIHKHWHLNLFSVHVYVCGCFQLPHNHIILVLCCDSFEMYIEQ